jgi:hypothetical protein
MTKAVQLMMAARHAKAVDIAKRADAETTAARPGLVLATANHRRAHVTQQPSQQPATHVRAAAAAPASATTHAPLIPSCALVRPSKPAYVAPAAPVFKARSMPDFHAEHGKAPPVAMNKAAVAAAAAIAAPKPISKALKAGGSGSGSGSGHSSAGAGVAKKQPSGHAVAASTTTEAAARESASKENGNIFAFMASLSSATSTAAAASAPLAKRPLQQPQPQPQTYAHAQTLALRESAHAHSKSSSAEHRGGASTGAMKSTDGSAATSAKGHKQAALVPAPLSPLRNLNAMDNSQAVVRARKGQKTPAKNPFQDLAM